MLKIKESLKEKIVNCKEGVSDFYEENKLEIAYAAGIFAGATISFVGFTIGHKQGVKNYELALYNKIIEETIKETIKETTK